jgi:cyclopropane fatty-acyl-phospholipid synthase-like methyltransferase
MSADEQIPYYRDLAEKHGNSRGVAGWGSSMSQSQRFEVLCRDFHLAGSAMLDVGCGRGDLLSYLEKTGRAPAQYCGVELLPEIAKYARDNHAGATVLVGDLSGVDAPPVDYAVSSGMFNLMIANHDEWMKRTLARMWSLARHGVAFNVISERAPEHRAGQYYAKPDYWLAWCQSLTPYVVLRHDYAIHDMTFFLFRRAVSIHATTGDGTF